MPRGHKARFRGLKRKPQATGRFSRTRVVLGTLFVSTRCDITLLHGGGKCTSTVLLHSQGVNATIIGRSE